MKIKNRLSLYFTAISSFVLLIVQVVLCLTINSLTKSNFYDFLMDRANIASQLYLEADEISADSLTHVREHYFQSLPSEVIRFYNDRNNASFIKDKNRYWPGRIIESVRRHKKIEFVEGKRQTVGIYYNDNQGNFVILVSAVDNAGIKRMRDLVESMIILLLAVTAGLFVISRWFAQKSLEPIDKVIGQMQLVRAGNLSLRVDQGNGKDEISALAYNFNRLLEHLENAFEMQQTFVLNASHELRTPITSIIGEIEITLNKLRDVKEYENVLQSVLVDAARLNETITTLLQLANADMNYSQPALSPIAIDELIWELNDQWTQKAGKSKFIVDIVNLPAEHDNLMIQANKPLLNIAFNNIISNAFKFSDNQPVTCELNADEHSIIIKITDVGVGIMPDDLDKVFRSFYRGTNVRDFNGNGIGLYVTNKIINLFNGTINVSSQPGKSTTMTIQFQK